MENQEKIIVVDDEKGICENVEKILLKSNYSVVHTQSAAKALEMMKKEQRVALVIGTNSYKRLPDLKNPINDARLMRDALQKIGFKVLYSENVTQNQFKKLVKRFSTLLSYGGVGLFYFAGHGIEVDKNNYLIPIGANISDIDDVKYEN